MIETTELQTAVDIIRSDLQAAKQRLAELDQERRGLLLDAQMGDVEAINRLEKITDEKAQTATRIDDLRTALTDAKGRLAAAEQQHQAQEREAQRQKIRDRINAAQPTIDALADATLRVQGLAAELKTAMEAQEAAATAMIDATGFGTVQCSAQHVKLRARAYLLRHLRLTDDIYRDEPTPLMQVEEHAVGNHLAAVEKAITNDLDAFDDASSQPPKRIRTLHHQLTPAQQSNGAPTAFFGARPAQGRVHEVGRRGG